jgi:hypothetical protein
MLPIKSPQSNSELRIRNSELFFKNDVLRFCHLFKITRNYARCCFLRSEGILRYFEWAKNSRLRICHLF